DDTPKPLYIPAGDAAEMEGKKPVFRYIESANPGDALACIFFICAVGLVIIPEIVYVKDIYTTSPRANTMFKLCYQAFIMFTLGIGYTFPRVFMHHDKKNRRYLITLAVSSILIFFAFVYPFYAIPGWYGKGRTYAGLDGTQFLSTYKETLGEPGPEGPPKEVLSMVDDVPIVEYLNNIKGQPVICEANEFAYKSYGRISATTGLPDIFNWYYHQVLWRTEDRKPEFDERIQDIKTIYTTSDPSAAKAALDKYKVKYIVVGLLERTKFSDRLNEELIKSLGTIVVQSNSTYLLEVSQ
ncbi:MAG: DUF2298 domain-containing protein, partial [Clostridiales bacterium]|nr:DUF2298 domain-containing protein [Clostridiales bacterium]